MKQITTYPPLISTVRVSNSINQSARGVQELRLIKIGRVCENEVRYTSPLMIFSICSHMASLDREHFVVLHLDGKNRIIAKETVSIGSLNQSIVHPREVFKAAVHNGSAAIICVHNHPSGDPAPSNEDKSITSRLCAASEILGIKILDHIIIGQDSYCSFVERGYMSSCYQGTILNSASSLPYKKEPSPAEKFRILAGTFLKESRKQAKMTQKKLFEATGIQQAYISSIETGWREIKEEEARKLAAVFNVDYQRFLFNPNVPELARQ